MLDYFEIKYIDMPMGLKWSSKSKRIKSNKKKLSTSIDEPPDSIYDRSEFGHW